MEKNNEMSLDPKNGDSLKPQPDAPVNPEKNVPMKPDKNPDVTKTVPGINEPEKADPTRIDKPSQEQQSNKG
jgi:hypothetical protein